MSEKERESEININVNGVEIKIPSRQTTPSPTSDGEKTAAPHGSPSRRHPVTTSSDSDRGRDRSFASRIARNCTKETLIKVLVGVISTFLSGLILAIVLGKEVNS